MSTSKKISQLVELTTPANDDVLPIVDTSTGETKRITFANVQSGGGGATPETPPETPNGVLTEFTVSAQPQWVVSDAGTYFEGSGYSYSSGTGKITMDIPPAYFIRALI